MGGLWVVLMRLDGATLHDCASYVSAVEQGSLNGVGNRIFLGVVELVELVT